MSPSPLLILAVAVQVTLGALPLPPFIKPCARSNPNFNQCALTSGRASLPFAILGSPEYKLPPLEPLDIKEVKVVVGTTGNNSLNIVIMDARITGLKDTYLLMTNFDFEGQHIHHEATVPRLQLLGKFRVWERFLLLPLSGGGDVNVTLVNTNLTYDVDYRLELIDGNRHLIPYNPVTTMSPTRMYTKQSHLFQDDPRLDQQLNNFLNDNWKDVFSEMEPIMNTVFREVLFRFQSQLDRLVPFDVTFPEHLPT